MLPPSDQPVAGIAATAISNLSFDLLILFAKNRTIGYIPLLDKELLSV
jgi:hypothetical protein